MPGALTRRTLKGCDGERKAVYPEHLAAKRTSACRRVAGSCREPWTSLFQPLKKGFSPSKKHPLGILTGSRPFDRWFRGVGIRNRNGLDRLFRHPIRVPFLPAAESKRFLPFSETGKIEPAILAAPLERAKRNLESHPAGSRVGFPGPAVQVHAVALRATRIKQIFQENRLRNKTCAAIPAAQRRYKTKRVEPLVKALVV